MHFYSKWENVSQYFSMCANKHLNILNLKAVCVNEIAKIHVFPLSNEQLVEGNDFYGV